MADDDLPIDVHYDKLIDWLVDRKKVSKDWRKKLAGVHAKLSELARELPGALTRAHGLGVPDSSLVDAVGEPPRWDYFRAVLVRDRIVAGADLRGDADDREEESSGLDPEGLDAESADDSTKKANEKTRGLFGRLAGKAKAWDDVVRAYEKDALHLPECGATMTRATDIETPFRRRESAKLAKQLGDAERRETEHRRGAVAAKEKFARTCLDVFGKESLSEGDGGRSRTVSDDETPAANSNLAGFRTRVDGLVAKLDSVFDAAVAAARDDAVGEAAEHYARWTEWAHGERIRGGGGEKNENDAPSAAVAALTPHLARLRAMSAAEAEALGRVSLTGTIRGADAFASADPDKSVPSSTNDDASLSIDPPAGGIDWDVDASAVETAVEIDWDVGDVVEVEAAGAVETAVEIDWDVGDVVVEDAGADRSPSPADSVSASETRAKASARAEDAEDADDTSRSEAASLGRALADRDFRARVLDDLLELRAFLAQRASDASSGESASLLSSAPAELRSAGADPSPRPVRRQRVHMRSSATAGSRRL